MGAIASSICLPCIPSTLRTLCALQTDLHPALAPLVGWNFKDGEFNVLIGGRPFSKPTSTLSPIQRLIIGYGLVSAVMHLCELGLSPGALTLEAVYLDCRNRPLLFRKPGAAAPNELAAIQELLTKICTRKDRLTSSYSLSSLRDQLKERAQKYTDEVAVFNAYVAELEDWFPLPDTELQLDLRRTEAAIHSFTRLDPVQALLSGWSGGSGERVALESLVRECVARNRPLVFQDFIRLDERFFDALQRYRTIAKEGSREGLWQLGRLLIIDRQFEAGVAVLLPLLNEGDFRAIREVAEYFLSETNCAEGHMAETVGEEFSRLRFFEALCQDERAEVRALGKVWAAIINERLCGKLAAERWLGKNDTEHHKDDLVWAELRRLASSRS
jgi:hypothetical protein